MKINKVQANTVHYLQQHLTTKMRMVQTRGQYQIGQKTKLCSALHKEFQQVKTEK